MSPEDQENFKFASWFKEVDQRKSTGQNWGSLDPYLPQFSSYENYSKSNVALNDIPNNFHVKV